MKNVNRWGLAAGLVAALALYGTAQAQSAAGGSAGSSSSGSVDRSKSGDTGGSSKSSSSDSMGKSSDTSSKSSTASGGTGSSATGTTGEKKVDKGLQEKLEKIHAANQAELQMAQLGTQNATSPDVKEFAQQMQTDHQKADQKLTEAAQSAGVTSLEGKKFQDAQKDATKDLQKLQSKTGKDFDKEYMSHMVKDHEKAIKDVDSAAKDAKKANQSELASFLEQTKTGMQGHLDHAKQVQKSLDQQGGQQRQGRRPSGATGSSDTGTSGSAGTGSSSSQESKGGSRGDTGGPPPSGGSKGPSGGTGQMGGQSGTSSEGSGQQQGGSTTK